MVGCFGAYFADLHDFVSADADGVSEAVAVPALE